MINLASLIDAIQETLVETITISTGERRKKIVTSALSPIERDHLNRILRVLKDPEVVVEMFKDSPNDSVRCFAAMGRNEYWEFVEARASGRIHPGTHILTPRG